MPSAVILGGTGVIGSATARRLVGSGWEVTVVARNPLRMPEDLGALGVLFVSCDRSDITTLRGLLGSSGPDLLVDCVCFTAYDAETLLGLAGAAGSTVMISSKAVYVDDAGNNVNSQVAPRFRGPITEEQPVMAPGIGDPRIGEGYGSHKVAAEQTLLDGDQPVTVIRPSKVHGAGGTQPREWVFVKRCLDRRTALLLADGGRSVDHTSAAANLAALIEVVAEQPARRILNGADPDAPTVLDIARAVAGHLDHTFEEVLLEPDADPLLGVHPWRTAQPIILDTSAALALGYIPAGDYAHTVVKAVEWMTERAEIGDNGAATLAGVDNDGFEHFFNYEREDHYMATNMYGR